MINITPSKILRRLKEEKNKGIKNLSLFLVSRFLRYSRLCYFFTLPLNGFKICFSPLAIPTSVFVQGDLEPETTNFFYQTLHKGDVCIDIGANVGTTALTAARAVGETGIVLCFEPNEKTYNTLVGNIKLNGFSNILPKQTALGDEEGSVLFSDKNNDDMNGISHGTEGNPVRISTLDLYTRNLNDIRLLKIDVEGYEMKVLQGAVETLKKTDIVFFESVESNAQNYGFHINNLIQFLKSHHFKITDLSLKREYEGSESHLVYPSNLIAINSRKIEVESIK